MPDLNANIENVWSRDTLGQYGEDPIKKTPFSIHIFPQLLKEEESVNQLRDAVNSSVKLKHKDNDLYKFKQSKDLKTQIQAKKLPPILHDFIDLMVGKIGKHLEKITGKKLSEKNFDITASRYDIGNYLLCHNDDIKDNVKGHERSLAFVYYLNLRNWTKQDGGALNLFDSDSQGEPISINNQVFPKPNTLIVFDTTPTSWHSVGEVLCKDDFRLSINGWYHSDRPLNKLVMNEFAEKSIEPCPYTLMRPIILSERIEKFFRECINQEYLMEKTCLLVRKRFKRKSEINLTNFLIKEKYQAISEALRQAAKDEKNLAHVGPYNKRNYQVLKQDKLPQICQDLFEAFRSDLFFMLLARLTGLDLVPPSINKNDNEKTDKEKKCGEDDDDDDEDDEDESDDDEEESDEDEEDDDEEEEEEEEEESDEDDDIKELNIAEQSEQQVINSSNNKKIKLDDEAPTTSKEENLEAIRKSFDKKKRKRNSDPLTRIEFRHLKNGSYTLLHDYEFEQGEKSALDVILHFNHDFEVNFNDGGYISYIDCTPEDDLHDMDCELLTVEPKSNCLSLVYRCDESTCRFLKYISRTHKNEFQDLYCVYYERPDDLPKLENSGNDKVAN